MTTLADVVVATLDPYSGKEILPVRRHGYKLLGAAALHDLLERGRLGRTGEGNRSRVVLLDPSAVPEPSLEGCLDTVRGHREQAPHNALLRLGGGIRLRERIHGGLATEGVIGPRERAGLLGSRYRVRGPDHQYALIGRLHAMLLGGRRPDEATRRLAALLTVGDTLDVGHLLDIVLDWPGAGAPPTGRDRTAARERAVEVGRAAIRDDWVALTAVRAITLPRQLAAVGATLGVAAAAIPG